MKYNCFLSVYEIACLSEPLDIFYAFATWKGKSALDIVTDWNSLGFWKGILTFQLVSYRCKFDTEHE